MKLIINILFVVYVTVMTKSVLSEMNGQLAESEDGSAAAAGQAQVLGTGVDPDKVVKKCCMPTPPCPCPAPCPCPGPCPMPRLPCPSQDIAQLAALEAKAAQEAQQAAGDQAARVVKKQLAEKAAQAAKAAEASWMGKASVVAQLEQELKEAETLAQEEERYLQQAQAMVNSAIGAAQQAQALCKMLQDAMNVAHANAGNAVRTAEGAQLELSEKEQLVEAARNRIDDLLKKLREAKEDCARTKMAAQKAHSAAEEARQNVCRCS